MRRHYNSALNFLTESGNLPAVVLVIFFLSELTTTIAYNTRMEFYNYSLVIKVLFIALVGIGLLKRAKTYKNILLFLSAMLLVFLIGQWSFNNYDFGPHFLENFIFWGRYLFVFIVLYFLSSRKSVFTPRFYNLYEKIVIINSLLVIATIVFDIPLFKTYYNRFGSAGAFMTPSMITYFNAFALTYFLYQYLEKKKKLAELILVSIVCFLTGTKALLFFFGLTVVHFIFLKRLYTKRNFYLILLGILGVLLLARKEISSFIYQNFKSLFEVYQEQGLLAALTSLRTENLKYNFMPVLTEKWNVLNYLFGGTDFEIYRVEFEIFDVFLFFGIIGSLLYLVFYFKNVINFNMMENYGKIQMGILLLTALISGNFFNNAPIALYLLIILSVLRNDTFEKTKL